jgi:hypothetical protein
MAELDQNEIRIVAYQLWERDGCPEGKADDYWHAAVKLLSDESHAREPKTTGTILPLPPAQI